MEHRLTATELARNVGDVLARIRYRGDSFLVERNGEPIARIVPLEEHPHGTVGEALGAWREAGAPDPSFADDLDRIERADQPPGLPWVS
jgi:prevent-host-death family protein